VKKEVEEILSKEYSAKKQEVQEQRARRIHEEEEEQKRQDAIDRRIEEDRERKKQEQYMMTVRETEARLRKMTGFLAKKGHVIANWQTRFFAIEESDMFYFVDDTRTKGKGKISLLSAQVEDVIHDGNTPHPFAFLLKPYVVSKDFLLSAQTAEEKEDWMNAIKLISSGNLSETALQKLKNEMGIR